MNEKTTNYLEGKREFNFSTFRGTISVKNNSPPPCARLSKEIKYVALKFKEEMTSQNAQSGRNNRHLVSIISIISLSIKF